MPSSVTSEPDDTPVRFDPALATGARLALRNTETSSVEVVVPSVTE